ncbi:MAG: Maltose operon protein B, partial [Escherichia coli DORA_A_5_14_21]
KSQGVEDLSHLLMTHSQPIMNVAVDDRLLQREKGMASVQLQNVTKAWGEVVVSKDINLDIHEGEFVVFVGPSGCGKSTLLRMISGLETITSGDLFIGEKRMNDTPPAERGVGMVFQSYALYPHLSVAENMSFGLKLAGAK